jgi:hypothetical protein
VTNPLDTVTAAQIKVFVTVLLTALYPGVNDNLRVAIIGAVVSIYVLASAIYKTVVHKAKIRTGNGGKNE